MPEITPARSLCPFILPANIGMAKDAGIPIHWYTDAKYPAVSGDTPFDWRIAGSHATKL